LADTPNPQYRGVRDLREAKDLAEKRRELDNLRHRDKIDWVLNREFYKGNQYSYWNKAYGSGGRLETEATDEGDKPHYKVRLTNNQILPGVNHYVAQLTKNRPIIAATPDSGSDSDLKSAQMGTALWDYWWGTMYLTSKLQSALNNAALSQGYWFIQWDALAGKSMTYMVGPDGQALVGPMWSDDNLDIYRDSLREAAQQQGHDPDEVVKQFTKTVSVGDISIKVLPGENVLLDPAAPTFEDAKYAFVIENMSPEEAAARWPKAKDIGPDAIPGDESLNLSGLSQENDRSKSVRRVFHGFFAKSPVLPKGRYVCWVEGPDIILSDTAWPFPFDELPIVKFPGLERPNSPLDIPVTTATRPIQKDINRTISQVMEHKNLTMRPQLLAPTGSISERITSEPGRTFYFNPINGAVPEWRKIPDLPGYVFEHLQEQERRLDRYFNRMPNQRDQLPARIDNADGIDIIQESVADQLSPTVQRLESALVRAGMIMAKLAQQYYVEERLLKIKGSNGAVQVKKFRNADLAGGFSFQAEAGSGLPRTRAGKQSRIGFMLENRLIDQRTAMRYMDTADLTGLTAKAQAAEEQAYRTIEKLKKGTPLNPLALEQAKAQAMQAMQDTNADLNGDGQPEDLQTKMGLIQQMLEQASLQPMPHEDPGVHLDVLTQFMDSVEFENLDPATQNRFSQRFTAMMQMNMQIAQASAQMGAPVERPKVTLQMKATSSAPVAGEILREAGVQVSDEAVAQPPLETWVTDSIDKADADDAGNDPFTDAEKMQTLVHNQEQHAKTMSKAAHEVSLAESKTHGAQQDASGHADARAEAEHQQRMRHAEEMHQAKLAAAKRPPAKPSGGK
jgi:hypothetical protein